MVAALILGRCSSKNVPWCRRLGRGLLSLSFPRSEPFMSGSVAESHGPTNLMAEVGPTDKGGREATSSMAALASVGTRQRKHRSWEMSHALASGAAQSQPLLTASSTLVLTAEERRDAGDARTSAT